MPGFEVHIESLKRTDSRAGSVDAVKAAIQRDARVTAVGVVGSDSGAIAYTCRVTADDGIAATAIGREVFLDALRAGGFDFDGWPLKGGSRDVR
jgi:hypothetical protein